MSGTEPFKDEALLRLLAGDAVQSQSMEDYYQYMGQLYYLVKDEEIQTLLREDPDMRVLMPALSHLLRTSNVVDPLVIMDMKINWRMACRMQIMVKKTPNLQSQARFNAWLNFGYAAIHDLEGGWRGKLVTERIKTYKIESGAPKRSSWLTRWFR